MQKFKFWGHYTKLTEVPRAVLRAIQTGAKPTASEGRNQCHVLGQFFESTAITPWVPCTRTPPPRPSPVKGKGEEGVPSPVTEEGEDSRVADLESLKGSIAAGFVSVGG